MRDYLMPTVTHFVSGMLRDCISFSTCRCAHPLCSHDRYMSLIGTDNYKTLLTKLRLTILLLTMQEAFVRGLPFPLSPNSTKGLGRPQNPNSHNQPLNALEL
jgi:hypothetical protein